MKLSLGILILVVVTVTSHKLETVYEWKHIDYLWDSNEQKERYIRNGDYDYENIVPIDVDKAQGIYNIIYIST